MSSWCSSLWDPRPVDWVTQEGKYKQIYWNNSHWKIKALWFIIFLSGSDFLYRSSLLLFLHFKVINVIRPGPTAHKLSGFLACRHSVTTTTLAILGKSLPEVLLQVKWDEKWEIHPPAHYIKRTTDSFLTLRKVNFAMSSFPLAKLS